MREIKFRGWDNENEYMITSLQGVYTALRNIMNITKQDDGYYNNGDLLKPNKEKYTLMQYTGLRDKNGNEIYEGDIVLIDKENQIKGQVKYSEQYASFIIVNTNSLADEAENLSDYSELEVIGNIYENLELLEVPQ